ncbi:multiubiquitin domain-containing protein (plasmid) [Mesorhizobium sp. AR07]|uniref:multiubiquitin domain-containing protein n=1 Tax=Mesorhizobium sp. AR07 TaxID=2865838 RepID=UPI0021600426|nr:multiubiquitin domain-containing protein [Mesorhizobium sp. AR07]UVK48418.1 multiubiquitin domain-containing protein [Mesorhizobium sp. AR07]
MADDADNERGQGPGSGGEGDRGGRNDNGDHSNPGKGGGHGDEDGPDRKIAILVNEKPVTVDDKQQTGMSIKQAAIAQSVQIQLDFVLSVERGGGKTDLIGDDQPIRVHKGDRFLAIPNDDNS